VPASRSRSFSGIYENLAQIADFVRESAVSAGLEGFALYAVETAVDEACSNIIEHTYGGENLGDILCTCLVTDDGLTVILRDSGQPFNPEGISGLGANGHIDDHPGHGLGLFLIKKMMDRVIFETPPEGGNILTMVKRRQIRAGPASPDNQMSERKAAPPDSQ